MPIYEYRCEKCGKTFEVIQKFSDAPVETHAECGGHVERLISTSALQFKGSGWYVTDYARKSSKGASSSGNGSNSSSAGEGKSETTKTEGSSSSEKSSAEKSSSDKSNTVSGKSSGEK